MHTSWTTTHVETDGLDVQGLDRGASFMEVGSPVGKKLFYLQCRRSEHVTPQAFLAESDEFGLSKLHFRSSKVVMSLATSTTNLAELFTGFFHFNAFEFNWCLHALCVRVNGTSGDGVDKKKLMTSTRAVVRRGSLRSQAQLVRKCTQAGRQHMWKQMA